MLSGIITTETVEAATEQFDKLCVLLKFDKKMEKTSENENASEDDNGDSYVDGDENDNDDNDDDEEELRSCLHYAGKYFTQYAMKAVLHGVRYISRRTMFER